MQGFLRAVGYYHKHLHMKKLSYSGTENTMQQTKLHSNRKQQITSSPFFPTSYCKGFNDADTSQRQSHKISEKGLQNKTVAEVLMTKGEEKVGSWLWCRTDDTVYDAVNRVEFLLALMVQSNIGSLVVLKPGEQQLIAGIFTERDYLRKVILQDRTSKYMKVGEIMTDRDKLITVTSDTSILQAMHLMTENHIRDVPVVDGRIVGMISILDVIQALLEQQHGEAKRLKDFIKGDYY